MGRLGDQVGTEVEHNVPPFLAARLETPRTFGKRATGRRGLFISQWQEKLNAPVFYAEGSRYVCIS